MEERQWSGEDSGRSEWPLPVVARTHAARCAGEPAPLPSGLGMIEINVDSEPKATAPELVLLDGQPIGAGMRYYEICVAPGRHTIEVHGGRVAYATVDVGAGERILLATATIARVRTERRSGYVIGRPPSVEATSRDPEEDKEVSGRTAATIVFGGIGWCVLAPVFDVDERLVLASPFLLLFAYVLYRFFKPPVKDHADRVREEWDFAVGRAEEAPLCDGPARHLTCQDELLEATLPGTTGLVIDFDLEKRRPYAANEFEHAEPSERFSLPAVPVSDPFADFVEPPMVFIEGQVFPTSWGTWFYPLLPGSYELELVVDGEFGKRVGHHLGRANLTVTRRAAVDIEEGTVLKIFAKALFYKALDRDREVWVSRAPSLDLE